MSDYFGINIFSCKFFIYLFNFFLLYSVTGHQQSQHMLYFGAVSSSRAGACCQLLAFLRGLC